MTFADLIKKNNETHTVDSSELQGLITQANKIYNQHFDNTVWFERSIFTNWTCAIADCKYCYLSTKPKLDKKAIRSRASILAESFICKKMGWKVGYITGGLRVESTEQMFSLLTDLKAVLGYKVMMNYGPYSKKEIAALSPVVTGMGCAIESFDEKLHEFICPSKPLPSLLRFLRDLQEANLQKLITIILGIGEKKSDVHRVIEEITKNEITIVQLCFLKPQEYTVFSSTVSPSPEYMAWWVAKLRIAHPKLMIKIALVKDRIEDFSLMLQAGANCFSRYMIFDDFASPFADQLQQECEKVQRKLIGNFKTLPAFSEEELSALQIDKETLVQMKTKIYQYLRRLGALQKKFI